MGRRGYAGPWSLLGRDGGLPTPGGKGGGRESPLPGPAALPTKFGCGAETERPRPHPAPPPPRTRRAPPGHQPAIKTSFTFGNNITPKKYLLKSSAYAALPLGEIRGKRSCEHPSLSCRPPRSRKTERGSRFRARPVLPTPASHRLPKPPPGPALRVGGHGQPCPREASLAPGSPPAGKKRPGAGLPPSPSPRGRSGFGGARGMIVHPPRPGTGMPAGPGKRPRRPWP